jgi:putative restriction endonuclease
MAEDTETRLRDAAFAWLDARDPDHTRVWRREELAACTVAGQPLPLIDRQQGIRVPRGWAAALSILTTYTPPGARPPYDDRVGPDGLPRYQYRGTDPERRENRALRAAATGRVPLIWFVATAPGAFVAVRPVWVVADEPKAHQVVLAVDAVQRLVTPGAPLDPERRRYVERVTRQRVHQPVFRSQVLAAYRHRCAVCGLALPPLLDAAHIVPDGHPRGDPVVPNGLALCKIHHAAFDGDLLGVRPDYVVEIAERVRDAEDGPMLRHGLQAMHERQLLVPDRRAWRPDPDRLAERYAQFREAG